MLFKKQLKVILIGFYHYLNEYLALQFKIIKKIRLFIANTQLIKSPSFGLLVEVHGDFELIHPENFTYGNGLSINGGVYINAGSNIELGESVSLSAKCMLITKGLHSHDMSKHYSKPIKIGSNVQVGAGAIVLSGVVITDNVIIAAGSVVTKNIKTPGVYAGVPCKRLPTKVDH